MTTPTANTNKEIKTSIKRLNKKAASSERICRMVSLAEILTGADKLTEGAG